MKTSRTLKYQKVSFSKKDVLQFEKHTFRVLEASKRHLKSFKTSKERVPKMEPKKQFSNQFLEQESTPK